MNNLQEHELLATVKVKMHKPVKWMTRMLTRVVLAVILCEVYYSNLKQGQLSCQKCSTF